MDVRSVFASAAAAGKRELVIKKGSHSPEQEAIEAGKYDALFSVTTLNHLQVSGFTAEVKELSSRVNQLDQLLQLILTQNGLVSLPNEIGALSKLKMLDVSQNNIAELPQSLYDIKSLHTLLLGQNSLNNSSFPDPPPDAECFPNLHHVNLSGNSLTKLPAFVYRSHALQEVYASSNGITALESEVGSLAALKVLDMKRNKLTVLPYEVVICSKLKTIGFEDNPIADRRLLKLIAQHEASKPKKVLDYISSHAPKLATSPSKSGGKKSKGKKSAAVQDASPRSNDADSDSEVTFEEETKPKISVVKPAHHVEVLASNDARSVRQYVVCAVVRGVDLDSGENYKDFISLQTKLHDTVCKRRRVATIATHDLSKLSPPLTYTCHPAEAISFTPLGWGKTVDAKQFLDHLEASKRDKRGGGGGGKKSGATAAVKEQDNSAAALSKYIQFVDPAGMVCIKDSSGNVVSLPPLTNCEKTKIQPSTCDLFLEVTSSDNLASCKAVMDSLIYGMREGGMGVRDDGVMYVEQARVADENGQLLVLYPSRTDLTSEKYVVEHPQK